MYMAIMPLAAQNQEMSLSDTILYAIWLKILVTLLNFLPYLKRKVFLETPLVDVLEILQLKDGLKAKA